ncbi:MAG: hypothetical protein DSM107014_01360 [Gomphosphaeria aponina SAG 52.96 = DSM 107014]|uniref:Uncharacterized protein n=1 Tax=Gomphosphaeria aponina SAG 52.96 = DSM 107014 TaxID=1521640 RepID=A0A941GTB0_9CHRO|nr:hypothetical protein [Gomphosphaeria aponina SAG 52.96 = DSM 107014]
MSYSDFSLRQLTKTFNLVIEEKQALFEHNHQIEIDSFMKKYISNNIPLAQAIGTEKAKSEMIIAPVLIETKRILNNQISLFSGIDFNVDSQQGLNGYCDFLISLSPQQLYVSSPVIMLVEAKNDNLNSGIPQCIAEMIAAQIFNESENNMIAKIYGIVTNANQWLFMNLEKNTVKIDMKEYYINNVEKIIGILVNMVDFQEISNK